MITGTGGGGGFKEKGGLINFLPRVRIREGGLIKDIRCCYFWGDTKRHRTYPK